MSQKVLDAPSFEATTDVAIVGAGAAGLVAALFAHERGRDVVVLERDAVPSGSTALSAGLIPAAQTRFQANKGISDTHAAFAADISKKAGGSVDAEAIRTVVNAVGPALEWLADRHGFLFDVIDDFNYPGHSAYRMHGLPERSGRALVDRLRAAVEAEAIPILTNALVDTLYQSVGSIVGVGYSRPDGAREALGAGAVILASNGYGGNPDLVRQHIPTLRDALWFGHSGNDGTALGFARALGAATAFLSGHQGHGSVAHPHGILITWATVSEGGFQVNRLGQRFHNEALGYSEAAAEVVAQPQSQAITIFDERIAGIARQFADFRQAEAQGAIVYAGSIAELAARIGLPEAALRASLETVEQLKQTGGTDAFGRSFAGSMPLTAPFAAVRVTGALFHTQGGLVVDDRARVLRPDGSAIHGLYAAGGAAAGVSGPAASGYLSGNGLLTAVALGAIAGATR